MFARKIIPGSQGDLETQNEARVIALLCKPPTHRNIVPVFQYGALMNESYFYYDMQLCDLNLDRYISGAFPDPLPEKLQRLKVPETARAKVQRALCILLDIAEGLAFIHTREEVHRDLKPENGMPRYYPAHTLIVLYSSLDENWKIGDFGLTVRGTSKNQISSSEVKGTGGYRAPELLKDKKYNNKVDLWAFGCITWELITERRAFNDDFETWGFQEGEREFPMELGLDEGPRDVLSRIVRECLREEANRRPTSKDLSNWLRRYLGFDSGPSMTLTINTDMSATSSLGPTASSSSRTYFPPASKRYRRSWLMCSNREYGRNSRKVGHGTITYAAMDDL